MIQKALKATWNDVKFAILFLLAAFGVRYIDMLTELEASWPNVLIYVMLILLGGRFTVHYRAQRAAE